jgi:beta-galactosidase
MLKRKVELGAQIYVNKNDRPEVLREWVRKLRRSGLTIFRVFIFWDIVEPAEGRWDFTLYDAVFDEAEKYGLSVIGTMWAVNPPGWMNITDTFRNFGDLNDPVYWAVAMRYVEKVTQRYHASPALNAWVSWKEATRPLKKNPNSIRAFKKYLERTYGTIEALNRVYYNTFESFDEVGLKPSHANHEFEPYPESLDWERFSNADLCEKLRDIYRTIRRIDKAHPIYVNPHNAGQNMQRFGQCVWTEAKEVDFLGLSNHPAWNAGRVIREPFRIRQYVAYLCDIIKSATPDPGGFYEVTEMQGGPTMMSGVMYATPSSSDMRHYTWECIGSGASRVLYWVFNIRTAGHEAGEWSLCGQDGEPTYRLDALTEAAELIRKNQALFDSAAPKKPDVWLLYSDLSWQMAGLEGGNGTVEGEEGGNRENVFNPRNRQYAPDALCAAYQMLADLGLTVKMISEEKVINGELPTDAVLIAPSVIAAEDGLCPALERFVRSGGTLIADFLLALKNKHGFIPDPGTNKSITDRIFGGVLADIISDPSEFTIDAGRYRPEGWFVRLPIKATLGGDVIGRFADGTPAVVRNSFGKGTAIRIGTTFFQRYLTRPLQENLDFLKSLLPERLFGGIRLGNPAGKLRLRELVSGDKHILILLNSGDAGKAVLVPDIGGSLKPLEGGDALEVEAGKPVELPIGAEEVRKFVLSPEK